MVLRLGSPGLYGERRPRAVVARVRTDVAGFVGFEPRIQPVLAALPAGGWRVGVRLAGCEVDLAGRQQVIAAGELTLWSGPVAPVAAGQQRLDTVVAARAPGAAATLAIAGTATANPSELLDPLPAARLSDTAIADAVLARLYPGADSPLARQALAAALAAKGRAPLRAVAEQLFALDPLRRDQLAAGPLPGQTWLALVQALFPAAAAVRTALARVLGTAFAWVRLAEVSVRLVAGMPVPCVHPCLPPTVLTNNGEAATAFGPALDDGTQLLAMVRAYFANGGERCHVATVRRPLAEDQPQLLASVDEMIGDPDATLETATGFARLALSDEVALADLPDLHAVHQPPAQTRELPSSADQGCFIPCSEFEPPAVAVLSLPDQEPTPIFDEDTVWSAQRRLIEAAARNRARIEVVLSPPRRTDPSTGRIGPPGAEAASAWRGRIATLREALDDRETELSAATLYWPWTWSLDLAEGERSRADAAAPGSASTVPETQRIIARPPTGAVLGVISRRDLARGPFVAPANETLRGVVGLTATADEALFRGLYPAEPIADVAGVAVNLLRAMPGVGVQVWGSRTLSRHRWLRHLTVRRGLSALQRRIGRALEPYVFEPHTPFLRLQLSTIVVNELMVAFRSGGLRGATPEDAFYARCDDSLNPPEEIELGRVWIEVGVAIAAPAEFIVFRLGRGDGTILVDEGGS